ncbi:MAG TPA: (5-formylfuran-3-yl)methyl phosphate synthase [Alphaproteobacteria bacterium]|nr:(5-formylfuran-3-yl)methyl phosphate synthase [Alphaproteobacteria bacterium]
MTGFLASIASSEELTPVLEGGADLIDVKDPSMGALGAASGETVRTVVEAVAGQRRVSATLGDLPMEASLLADAARRTTAAGVDYVKVGIFPDGDVRGCIAALGHLATEGVRLVAVLFADRGPDIALLDRLAGAGFAGAMLDTASKDGGALPDHLPAERLALFVERCRSFGLMTGLAGSLRLEHIAPLVTLQPDYLGFRGALCREARTSRIEAARVRAVRQELDQARSATAAAGALIAAASRASGVPSTSSAKSR